MSTSGDTTFSLTRDQICNAAIRKLAALGDGASPTATQLSNAAEALNVMLISFETDGMPLWAIKEYSMPLTATNSYTIGIGQTINTPAPLKITQAILKDVTAVTSLPMNIYSRYDYNLLPINGATGTPITLMYIPQVQLGTIRLWPIPDAYSIANRQIQLTYQRPFEDFVSGTDTLDFPQYWYEAVIYGLASRLAPEFGIPIQDRADLDKKAEFYHEKALSFGTEEGSLFFQPDWVGKK